MRGKPGHGGYCFRCGAYDAFVRQTWIGDASFAWTRRLRRCEACGCRWLTVEVLDPTSPLLAELRAAAAALVPPDPQFALDLISPAETAGPDWREVRTWR